MTRFAFISTPTSLMVMDTTDGRQVRLTDQDTAFQHAVKLAASGDFEAVLALDRPTVIGQWGLVDGEYAVKVDGGRVFATVDGLPVEVPDGLVDRVMRMIAQKFDPAPLLAFIGRLMRNPSKASAAELIGFLEKNDLPITVDGYFMAYKMVRADYSSIHDRKFMNKVGTWVEMPRDAVDGDRDRTCSTGLHFCSKEYLTSYGSSNPETDRVLLLKIDPADVVSIPSDYNNAKGRACRYFIQADITTEGWRNTLSEKDYTDSAVVNEDGFLPDQVVKASYECPHCHSHESISKGTDTLADGTVKARRKCKGCKKNFYV